jgi:FkbM family methyltransferase
MSLPKGPSVLQRLTFRAKVTYLAHLFKACFKQHHKELKRDFELLIPRHGIVIDVGAHAGQYAKLFAKIAADGLIIGIEPGSYAFSILKKAVRINRLKNIAIENVGVGEEDGELTLSVPVKTSGSIGFGRSHFGPAIGPRKHLTETVPILTVDGIVARYELQDLHLLKADIEGWEMKLLRGAEKTIHRFHPAIYLELVSELLENSGDSLDGVWDFLEGHGYSGFRFTAQGRLSPTGRGSEGDVVFMPKDHPYLLSPQRSR